MLRVRSELPTVVQRLGAVGAVQAVIRAVATKPKAYLTLMGLYTLLNLSRLQPNRLLIILHGGPELCLVVLSPAALLLLHVGDYSALVA